MKTGMLAVRYARALLEYAYEMGYAAQVYERMKSLAGRFAAFPELSRILANPMADREEKIALVLEAAEKSTPDKSEVVERFVRMVFNNHREDLLHSTALQYAVLYRQREGIHFGSLTTATVWEKKEIENLRSRFEALVKGPVELEIKINEDLIGGFMLELDMNSLDASVRGQLDRIQKELLNNTTSLCPKQ